MKRNCVNMHKYRKCLIQLQTRPQNRTTSSRRWRLKSVLNGKRKGTDARINILGHEEILLTLRSMIHVISTLCEINFKQRIYRLYNIETKHMRLLGRPPNTKFNLNPLCSFGGEIYSFVKLLCCPTEPPKYGTRIERDPGTIMIDENRAKNIETIKSYLCDY